MNLCALPEGIWERRTFRRHDENTVVLSAVGGGSELALIESLAGGGYEARVWSPGPQTCQVFDRFELALQWATERSLLRGVDYVASAEAVSS